MMMTKEKARILTHLLLQFIVISPGKGGHFSPVYSFFIFISDSFVGLMSVLPRILGIDLDQEENIIKIYPMQCQI